MLTRIVSQLFNCWSYCDFLKMEVHMCDFFNCAVCKGRNSEVWQQLSFGCIDTGGTQRLYEISEFIWNETP